MPYINIQIEFKEEVEEWDGSSYTHYTPISAEFMDSDIPSEGLEQIAEASGQSDLYQVGVANAMMYVLDGGRVLVSEWYS